MYVWFWRHLPGPFPLRLLLSALVLAVIVLLLFFWIFPAIEPHLPFGNVTVEPGDGAKVG
ncbi:MAG: hypothetical protein JWL64_1296 [Frankiales bacterium]|nr:hypothetical protein [Frankiales bacterium]